MFSCFYFYIRCFAWFYCVARFIINIFVSVSNAILQNLPNLLPNANIEYSSPTRMQIHFVRESSTSFQDRMTGFIDVYVCL